MTRRRAPRRWECDRAAGGATSARGWSSAIISGSLSLISQAARTSKWVIRIGLTNIGSASRAYRAVAELRARIHGPVALGLRWGAICARATSAAPIAGAAHQFWFTDVPSVVAASYVVMLPLDALTELRAEAVLRFWRALAGRPPGPRHFDLPPHTRSRHILILRAIDSRTDSGSYRKIAETLLGFRGNKADWESDPRKNQARRLVADGTHYVRGGYRDLLHYPVRLPTKR